MKKLLVLAALGLTISACKSEIDNKPAAVVEEPAAAEKTEQAVEKADEKAPEAAEATQLKLGPDSKVEWVGAKVTGDHTGGFEKISGMAELDKDGNLTKVEVNVDTTSIYSDADKLTEHLKSDDFFSVEKFPTAKFEATKIEAKPSENGTHEITGNMTIRDQTKTITIPAKVDVSDAGVKATSEFTLKRFDFGIEYKGKADDLIKDEVLMKLTLNFPKQ